MIQIKGNLSIARFNLLYNDLRYFQVGFLYNLKLINHNIIFAFPPHELDNPACNKLGCPFQSEIKGGS